CLTVSHIIRVSSLPRTSDIVSLRVRYSYLVLRCHVCASVGQSLHQGDPTTPCSPHECGFSALTQYNIIIQSTTTQPIHPHLPCHVDVFPPIQQIFHHSWLSAHCCDYEWRCLLRLSLLTHSRVCLNKSCQCTRNELQFC